MPSSSKKTIAIIGATGAQGSHVIKALLLPSPDGTLSPYALAVFGAGSVKGSVVDFASVEAAFKGAYGAFVNTDGTTVGEQAELFAGTPIFELAKQADIKHYVWGNFDCAFKKSGYSMQYRAENYDGKGHVTEWLKTQASEKNSPTWSVLTLGPYVDMLHFYMFVTLNKRDDGAFVFASPVGSGHVLMVSLKDVGYFARYIFDHPRETSAQDLEIASDIVGWDRLVATFTKVTGQKAAFVPLTLDKWWDNFTGIDQAAADFSEGFKHGLYKDKTSFRQNISGFWTLWRHDILTGDMDWARLINLETEDLETWMKRVGYTGGSQHVLKNWENNDSDIFKMNMEKTRML